MKLDLQRREGKELMKYVPKNVRYFLPTTSEDIFIKNMRIAIRNSRVKINNKQKEKRKRERKEKKGRRKK